MLKYVPDEIKRIFIFTFIGGLLAFFLGLVLNIKEIYIALTLGIFFSIISNILLLLTVYLLVYRSHRTYISFIRYIFSYAIYGLSMYISYFFCQNIYSILLNALGLCSFKLICYFVYNIKFKRKKVHKD